MVSNTDIHTHIYIDNIHTCHVFLQVLFLMSRMFKVYFFSAFSHFWIEIALYPLSIFSLSLFVRYYKNGVLAEGLRKEEEKEHQRTEVERKKDEELIKSKEALIV